MESVKGFEPVFDRNSKVLILGSFPSVMSRKTEFYYGNPQNRFWGMLSSVLDVRFSSVETKRSIVLEHKIALWDIVTRCEIKGSMDSDIKNYEVADLSVILENARIEKILCNGAKAYEIFCKAYGELKGIAKKMPSTSSANIRYDQNVWSEELKGL